MNPLQTMPCEKGSPPPFMKGGLGGIFTTFAIQQDHQSRNRHGTGGRGHQWHTVLIPLFILFSLALLSISPRSFGSEPKPSQEKKFVGEWVRGGPYRLDRLGGKVVVLYFFEKNCSICVKQWFKLMDTEAIFRGQPVLFIAVNSGNTPKSIKNHLGAAKGQWPVLADQDRRFELQFGFTISPRVPLKVVYVSPNGNMETQDKLDQEKILKLAKTATWKFDPENIPAPLEDTWKLLEFGQYEKAAPEIIKAIQTGNPDVRKTAKLMKERIDKVVKQLQKNAEEAEVEERFWDSYKYNKELADGFKKFPTAKKASEKVKALKVKPEVQLELVAENIFNRSVKLILEPQNKTDKADGFRGMDWLVKERKETEAGKKAAEFLKKHKLND